jgi:hypothetical protein
MFFWLKIFRFRKRNPYLKPNTGVLPNLFPRTIFQRLSPQKEAKEGLLRAERRGGGEGDRLLYNPLDRIVPLELGKGGLRDLCDLSP